MALADPSVYKKAAEAILADKDPRSRVTRLTQLRDALDGQAVTQVEVVQACVPVLLEVLTQTESSIDNADERAVRLMAVEALRRVGFTDTIREYAESYERVALNMLRLDGEENATAACTLLMELYKAFSTHIKSQGLPCIEFLSQRLRTLPAHVTAVFSKSDAPVTSSEEDPSFTSTPALSRSSSMTANAPAVFIPGIHTFKVMYEAIGLLHLTLQCLGRDRLGDIVRDLVAPMVTAMTALPPTGAPNACRAGSRVDLANLQMRIVILSLAFQRDFPQHLAACGDQLAVAIVQLLATCPPDAITVRKSHLENLRSLLGTALLAKSFSRVLDRLLDENVLYGPSRVGQDIIQLTVMVVLAELSHVFRAEFMQNLALLERLEFIFCNYLLDASLPLSLQLYTLRVLITISEMLQQPMPVEFMSQQRVMTLQISHACVKKLETLRPWTSKIAMTVREREEKEAEREKSKDKARETEKKQSEALASQAASPLEVARLLVKERDRDRERDKELATLAAPEDTWVPAYQPTSDDKFSDSVHKELKSLVLYLHDCVKSTLVCLNHLKKLSMMQGQTQSQQSRTPPSLLSDETALFSEYVENSISTMVVFFNHPLSPSALHSLRASEQKRAVETFISALCMLHPSNFRSVMSPKLEFLVDQLASDRHTQLLSIPTNIMMATNLSPSMADLLMAFLNARLPKLADVSNPTSHVMVQLYRLLFMSLTKVAENHNVLRHYIADFLSTCLRLTCEVRHPNHYFTLLRHLFRCIGSSKLEVLHKEIIPMLPELYQGLMRLHIRGPPSLRDSCLEICLSTPARLPTLLTFVPLLMNAIVAALQSNDESVIKLGLRTLDFWIDNFNPEYISPIMQPHLNTLMRILSSFLAPSSSSLGNLALQVLGKLGGRNRQFLLQPANLTVRQCVDEGVALSLPVPALGDNEALALRFDQDVDMDVPPRQNVTVPLPIDSMLDIVRDILDRENTHCFAALVTAGSSAVPASINAFSSSAASNAPSTTANAFNASAHTKAHLFHFLRSTLLAMLNLSADAVSLRQGVAVASTTMTVPEPKPVKSETGNSALREFLSASQTAPTATAAASAVFESSEELALLRSRLLRASEEGTFRNLLVSLFASVAPMSDASTSAPRLQFIDFLCRHFALLLMTVRDFSRDRVIPMRESAAAAPAASVSIDFIDPIYFLDALMEVLSDEHSAVAEVGEHALRVFLDSLVTCASSHSSEGTAAPADANQSAAQLQRYIFSLQPAVSLLFSRLSHLCNHDSLSRRAAGAFGICALMRRVSWSWLRNNMPDILKTLLAVFKDERSEGNSQLERMAGHAISMLLRVCLGRGVLNETAEGEAADVVMAEPTPTVPAVAAKPTKASKQSKVEAAAQPAPPAPAADPAETENGSDMLQLGGDDGTFVARDEVAPNSNDRLTCFRHIIQQVAPMIISAVPSLRQQARSIFEQVADRLQRPLNKVLQSIRQHLLSPQTLHQLQSFSVPDRVGVISAIAFGLQLPPPFFVLDASLLALLDEALRELSTLETQLGIVDDKSNPANAVGDVGASSLSSGYVSLTSTLPGVALQMPVDGHATRAVHLLRLRLACMQMLISALASPIVREDRERLNDLRHRTVRVFFRALFSRSPEIVDVAVEGLRSIVEYERLSKDMLTECLRPVLMNLADFSKLSVFLLVTLRRLLELMSSCFHMTLGEKLLEHLVTLCANDTQPLSPVFLSCNYWTTTASALLKDSAVQAQRQTLASMSLREGDDVKLAAGIVNLFHFLPPAPERLLEPFVVMCMRLESMLPSQTNNGGFDSGLHSPYRVALVQYLNKFPVDATRFFLDKLSDRSVQSLLLAVLNDQASAPLRATFREMLTTALELRASGGNAAVVAASSAAANAVANAAASRSDMQVEVNSSSPSPSPTPEATVPSSPPSSQPAHQSNALPLHLHPQLHAGIAAPFLAVAFHAIFVQHAAEAPRAFVDNDTLCNHVIAVWTNVARVRRLQRPHYDSRPQSVTDYSPWSLDMLAEHQSLIRCLIMLARQRPDKPAVLFHLLDAFQSRYHMDSHIVSEFFRSELFFYAAGAQENTQQYPENQHYTSIVSFFLQTLQNGTFVEHRVRALKLLISPLFQHCFAVIAANAKGSAVQPAILKSAQAVLEFLPELMRLVYTSTNAVESASHPVPYDDDIRAELLAFLTLLLQNMNEHPAIYDARAMVVRFAWSLCKSENSVIKLRACGSFAQFCAKSDSAPEQYVKQLFEILLMQHTAELRPLAVAALDNLIPVLPQIFKADNAMVSPENGNRAEPVWVRSMKNILRAESAQISVQGHIFHLIVRHADVMYPYRKSFENSSIIILQRFGMAPQRHIDLRKLSLDLSETLINWEKKYSESLDGAEPDSNSQLPEGVCNFLCRMILLMCEPLDLRPLARRSLKLFRDAMMLWKNVNIKFSYVDRAFDKWPAQMAVNGTSPPDPSNLLFFGLDLVSIVLQHAPQAYILQNIPTFKTVITKGFKICQSSSVRRLMHTCYYRLMFWWPWRNRTQHPTDVTELYNSLRELALTGLKEQTADRVGTVMGVAFVEAIVDSDFSLSLPSSNGSHVPQTAADLDGEVLSAMAKCSYRIGKDLLVLQTQLAQINKSIASVNNQISTMTHQHAQAAAQAAQSGHPPPPPLQTTTQQQQLQTDDKTRQRCRQQMQHCVEALCRMVRLLRDRLHCISSEARRLYLQMMVAMLEKCLDQKLLNDIAVCIQHWVTCSNPHSPSYTALTLRERVALVLRMSRFERLVLELASAQVIATGQLHMMNTAIISANIPQLLSPAVIQLAADMHNMFLETLLSLFQNTAALAQRPDWFSKVLRTATIGLRIKDNPALRSRFVAVFASLAPRSLVGRFEFILSLSEWEHAADSYWLSHGLDLLLDGLESNLPLHIGSNSASVPAVSLQASAGSNAGKASAAALSLVDAHAQTLRELDAKCSTEPCQPFSSVATVNWVRPLRQLLLTSPRLSHSIFVALFSRLWPLMHQSEHARLQRPLLTLLTRDWLKRQPVSASPDSPHVVQTLIESVAACSPPMYIPPSLLRYSAKSFNCWHSAIKLLEDRLAFEPTDEAALDALTDLFSNLNEHDVISGIWLQRANNAHSKGALVYEQFSLWPRAQDIFFTALNKMHNQQIPSAQAPASSEVKLWEDEWVRCAQHLNQWDVLNEFARSVGNIELQLDCAWKLQDWTVVRERLPRYPMADTSGNGKMLQIYLALAEKRVGTADREVEKLCEQANLFSLREWQQLPSFVSQSHFPLLQRFQLLVELQESVGLLTEVINSARRNQNCELVQRTISSWRQRLPNKWDELPVWSRLLTWRTHMYGSITSIYNVPDTSPVFVTLSDSAWTTLKFAQIARKQQMNNVCLTSLQRLNPSAAMDPRDSFTRIREQIKICLQSQSEGRSALQLINSTNLEYFDAKSKAELFRLKGETLQQLGLGNESNVAFSAALTMHDTFAKGWLSWATFCDRVFGMRKELEWAEFAVCCFLQAVAHGHNRSRLMISRVLWVLGYDHDQTSGYKVHTAFSNFSEYVPPWVWLLWVPQLITSLSRLETRTVRNILMKVVKQYPQAVYYSLRALAMEKKEQRQTVFNELQKQAQRNVQLQLSVSSQQPTNASLQGANKLGLPYGLTDQNLVNALQGAGIPLNAPTPLMNEASQRYLATLHATNQHGFMAYRTAMMQVTQQIQQQAQAAGNNNAAAAGTDPAAPASTESTDSAQVTAAAAAASVTQQEAATQFSNQLSSTLSQQFASITRSEELVTALRREHPALYSELDRISEELSRRFKPELEEELHASVHALFLRCFKSTVATPTVTGAPAQPPVPPPPFDDVIPASLISTLERVHRKFFLSDFGASSPGSAAAVASRRFCDKYQAMFERDFLPSSSTFPSTVTELTRRLKRWKTHLTSRIERWSLVHNKLQRISPLLARLAPLDVEIPGQYVLDEEPTPEQHALLHRFEPDVLVQHSSTGASTRRIGFRAADGKLSLFAVMPTYISSIRSEERLTQLYTIVNRLLCKYKESRKRQLVYQVQPCFALSNRVRLVESPDDTVTMGEVFDRDFLLRGLDSDETLLIWRREMLAAAALVKAPASSSSAAPSAAASAPATASTSSPSGSVAVKPEAGKDLSQLSSAELDATKRRHVYDLMARDVVSDKILLAYFARSIPAADQWMHFRKELAGQMALASFMSFVLCIGDRGPHKFSVSRSSARVQQLDFYHTYSDFYFTLNSDTVPFRLTRNITALLGPWLIDGVFAAGVTGAAACLARNQELMKNFLSLFHRDDLVMFHSSRVPLLSDSEQQRTELQLRDRIGTNVRQMLKRVHGLMPSQSSSGPTEDPPSPVNSKVLKLVESATDPALLANMPPTWQPWF